MTKSPKEVVKELKINSSGQTVRIEDTINCKSKSFIYVLQSEKDPKQYCGQSGSTVGRRTLQHASDIENDLAKAVPRHFRETRSEKEDLRMTPVMLIKSNNPWVRLHFEREFINQHDLIEEGINVNL